jgi:hypothetical protein
MIGPKFDQLKLMESHQRVSPAADPEFVVEKITGPQFNFNFRFGEVIDKNIEQLRVLNQSYLPVQYSETFYKGVIERGPKFAYFGNKLLIHFSVFQ